MPRRSQSTPAFGVLSHLVKDHLYVLDGGHIYTSPWMVTQGVIRRAATILLTAQHAPFEIGIGKRIERYQATAIKPLVKRSLRATDVQLISLLVSPLHRHFRAFRTIRAPGVVAMPRESFLPFDSAIGAAYRGELNMADATHLFEGIIATTVQHLPKSKHADPRADRMIELLLENPDYGLKELAEAIGVSYGRMSHLFTDSMGLSLRSFQLWLKVHRALEALGPGKKLTDIAGSAGFTDLAHLSRIVQQAFGAPLTYFLHGTHLKIFHCRRAHAHNALSTSLRQAEIPQEPVHSDPLVLENPR